VLDDETDPLGCAAAFKAGLKLSQIARQQVLTSNASK
jgi:hypothetical protein